VCVRVYVRIPLEFARGRKRALYLWLVKTLKTHVVVVNHKGFCNCLNGLDTFVTIQAYRNDIRNRVCPR